MPHGFLLAPHVVAGSDAVATLSSHLTARLVAVLGLEVHWPPLTLPAQTVSPPWHERTQADAAHRWPRECCDSLAASGKAPWRVPWEREVRCTMGARGLTLPLVTVR